MTKIEIIITTTGTHVERRQSAVFIDGSGSVEHYIEAIRAAMVASSYEPETAARVRYCEADE